MKINNKWALIPLFFINFLNSSFCYNFKTHNYLGNILENYLEKNDTNMFYNVKGILLEPLGNASIWADKVKFQKDYAWTRQLHYIDILECNKEKSISDIRVDHYCEHKCITSALQNFTFLLKYQLKNNDADILNNTISNRDLFKFILHFLQDFNQPMHLMGFYRGGNSYTIIRNKNGRNKTMNLHSLWDSELPEYFIENYGPYIPYKVEIQKINNQKDYKEMLMKILNKNLNITCSKQLGVSDGNSSMHYIIFEEYFKENELRLLFDNYIYLAVNTINYIFG